MEGDPLDLYQRLRITNSAPYCGFMAFDGGSVMSTSPELLLSYNGQQVFTRPIKGTAARFEDPVRDQASREALLASEKDRAELAMIVDLERNDLGRIAQTGSVHVDQFPELETYARVHHLVATVRALPKPGVDAIDLLHALFPGGSITGAPKLASMEAIARLEGEGRGFFTGSMGFLDFTGSALFNILIRTVIWRPTAPGQGEISFRVGGGITHASVSSDEDLETLQKAAGLIDAWQ
jgi:para-aminobenzoate synthetase component 1